MALLPVARKPHTHAQILVSLGEFGDFEESSGGELNSEMTNWTPAGASSVVKIRGNYAISDLVLTRAYDPALDALLVQWVKQCAEGIRPDDFRTAIKIVHNAQGIPIDSIPYAICKPMHLKLPDAKAGDSSIAQLTLTLAVEAFL